MQYVAVDDARHPAREPVSGRVRLSSSMALEALQLRNRRVRMWGAFVRSGAGRTRPVCVQASAQKLLMGCPELVGRTDALSSCSERCADDEEMDEPGARARPQQ
jgi:hypothetical protein